MISRSFGFALTLLVFCSPVGAQSFSIDSVIRELQERDQSIDSMSIKFTYRVEASDHYASIRSKDDPKAKKTFLDNHNFVFDAAIDETRSGSWKLTLNQGDFAGNPLYEKIYVFNGKSGSSSTNRLNKKEQPLAGQLPPDISINANFRNIYETEAKPRLLLGLSLLPADPNIQDSQSSLHDTLAKNKATAIKSLSTFEGKPCLSISWQPLIKATPFPVKETVQLDPNKNWIILSYKKEYDSEDNEWKSLLTTKTLSIERTNSPSSPQNGFYFPSDSRVDVMGADGLPTMHISCHIESVRFNKRFDDGHFALRDRERYKCF